MEIVEEEAQVVRRIFVMYLEGHTARDIAAALNKDEIAGPRGGHWNASTIAGSRKRRNGVLSNELYGGRIVWNRQRFEKDPDNGKRVSRPNPEREWMIHEAEHLRIVDQDKWNKVQAKLADRAVRTERQYRPRGMHLLSGMLKCGRCGGGYVLNGKTSLVCSRWKESGRCDNSKTVARKEVEARVLRGVVKHLGDPELVAEFVREYHRATREMNLKAGGKRREIDKRLSNIQREVDRLIDAIAKGTPPKMVNARLVQLEAEKEQAERDRSAVVVDRVEFHANAADLYRKNIRDLQQALADGGEAIRHEALLAIRELVERVVISPAGPDSPVRVEVIGELATILKLSEEANTAAPVPQRIVVAGARFELATFRL